MKFKLNNFKHIANSNILIKTIKQMEFDKGRTTFGVDVASALGLSHGDNTVECVVAQDDTATVLIITKYNKKGGE